MELEQRTTMNIEKKTMDRIKTYKITKRDTYDEILNRMMDSIDKSKEESKTTA